MTERMQPSWTELVWPPASPIASKAEAREWLGLYGDESVDDQIQTALDAAVEKVAAHVGFRISDTTVTDHYPPGALQRGGRLELSEPGVDWAGAVSVKYLSSNGGQIVTASATRWKRDATADANVIRWTDAAPVLYKDADNPVQVVYRSKLLNVLGAPVVGRIKLAVNEALAWTWTNRGVQSADAKLLDRRLSALLQSAKRRARR